MITKIISGGQIGADQPCRVKRLGIPTGGFVPNGFLTEAGPRPDLAAEYGLEDTGTATYTDRTERNVRLAVSGAQAARRSGVNGRRCFPLPGQQLVELADSQT